MADANVIHTTTKEPANMAMNTLPATSTSEADQRDGSTGSVTGFACKFTMEDGSTVRFTYFRGWRAGSRMMFATADDVLTFEDDEISTIQIGAPEID